MPDVMSAIRQADREIVVAGESPTRAPSWTEEEELFMIEKLGYLTDDEIGAAIGRTGVAVRVHRVRDMMLPGPSKVAGIVTAQGAGRMLGVESRKPAYWVDKGLLRGRKMSGGRVIRLIEIKDLERWVVNPKNWIYFDVDEVQDARLKRLIDLRKERWGDAWWRTGEVAAHHGVDVKDVTRYISHGKLPGVQTAVSLGGRHENRRWHYWFVLRSDALKVTIHTRQNPKLSFTPEADAWILKARDEYGRDYPRIGRSMKRSGDMVRLRYRRLKSEKEISQV